MQASGLTKFSPFICTSAEEVKWSESHSVVSDPFHPLDYIVHGILQARILEWVAFPFSRGSFQPRDRTQASRLAGGFFLSYLGPNPVLLFTLKRGRWLLLTFPQLLSSHHRGWQHLLDLGFQELSFTFGGQKSLMAVIFFVYWYGKIHFHFTHVFF